jgi:protease-4
VFREGSYQSVAETFTRRGMSPEQREQLDALLGDHWDAVVEGIAEGRGLDPARVRELADRGPYGTREACEAGLVDGALFADELEPVLEQLAAPPPPERPGPRRVRLVDAPVYHWFRGDVPDWRPLTEAWPRIAYVVASGAIHRGGGLRGVGAEAYRQLLARLRGDESVRAVVLRIDSPGGDGLASDLLWRELRRIGREKPVVASLGDVAASGGYYLAAAADAILAEAGTVTGSIGVVAGKLNLEALYRRLGVKTEALERGARAGLLSETRALTPDERGALRGEVASHYELFLERVCEGRGRRREEVEPVARGRIWSGVRARSAGLVDALGGPLEALAEARRRAGLTADEPVQLDVLPGVARLPGLRRLLPGR